MSSIARAVLATIVASLALLSGAVAWADIGQIKSLSGEVYLIRNSVQQRAAVGGLVQQGDVLATGANSSAGITFVDNSRLSVGSNTRIEIAQYRYDPTTQEGVFLTDIKRGTLYVVSGTIAKQPGEPMKVRTPTTVIAVRGTTLAVKVEE
ncbi:MAG: FecR domain-containing protein [Deltaproteobacteria bacterium]|nr:FecR domain-containing protein [Deltaproteobacteria bacterium]